MDIALIMPGRDTQALGGELARHLPGVRIQVWPKFVAPDQIGFAVLWNPPTESLAGLDGLRAVTSLGAGADALVGRPEIEVPIGRLVPMELSEQMTAYLLASVLEDARELGGYRSSQAEGLWKPRLQPVARRVGFLGLGEMGRHAAEAFVHLGWPVSAWTRSGRSQAGVDVQAGRDGLFQVAAGSDYLICLLPLTPQTRGLIDAELLAAMPEQAVLIQVGRGDQVVEADLVQALDRGRPRRARLDVFSTEPLPPGHPFWHHPRIDITPHIAAITPVEAAAREIAESYRQVMAGSPPSHAIDPDAGY